MSRKQFIESHGATCLNWAWSWSFVNHDESLVIFGAWDVHTESDRALILDQDWETNREGHRRPGYSQAVDHLDLVEEEDYQLKTFPIERGSRDDATDEGPAEISGFTPELSEKVLSREEGQWFALDPALDEGERTNSPALTKEELVLVLDTYLQIEEGTISKSNPRVEELARLLRLELPRFGGRIFT